MPNSQIKKLHGSRTVALLGPYGAGKTSLLESIAHMTGAVPRKGQVSAGTSLGDTSPEARARQMSVDVNVLSTHFLSEDFTFLDCPGSIEFLADTLNVLPGIDAAVVVCEPDAGKTGMLQPYLKALSDAKIPHFIFVNKFDKASSSLRGLLALLQEESETPLLLRQIPIWENGLATGFVDLALERAFSYGMSDKIIGIADIRQFATLRPTRPHPSRLVGLRCAVSIIATITSDFSGYRRGRTAQLPRHRSRGLIRRDPARYLFALQKRQ